MHRRSILQFGGTAFAAVIAGCNTFSETKTQTIDKIHIWNRDTSTRTIKLNVTSGKNTLLNKTVTIKGESKRRISLNTSSVNKQFKIQAILVQTENTTAKASLTIFPQNTEGAEPVVVIGEQGDISVVPDNEGLRPLDTQN